MKISRLIIISILLILTAAFLSGCSGGALATSWPGLLVDDNTGYLADNAFVYAVNLENGSLKWKYPADKAEKNKFFYAPPVITEDGQLIVGGYDHVLYSLDKDTGAVLWTFPRPGGAGAKDRYIASPLVTAQGIFAPNADGYLYALDLKGNQLWAPFKTSEQPVWAQPATNGNCECLYVSSMDHYLYAIDATTGSQIWKSDDLDGAIVATPTFDEDGTIFVGTFGNEMLALDAQTGGVKWRSNTTGWVWSSAALYNGDVLFGDLKGSIYSLTTSGSPNWNKQVDGSVVGTPLIMNNVVYYGTEGGTVYATNPDGSPAWSTTVSGKIYSPILSSADTLYVTPSEGDALMVAMTTTGTLKWSFIPPK